MRSSSDESSGVGLARASRSPKNQDLHVHGYGNAVHCMLAVQCMREMAPDMLLDFEIQVLYDRPEASMIPPVGNRGFEEVATFLGRRE